MNTSARQLFIGRFDLSYESEEQVLGRELSDLETEAIEASVANHMVEEGLIASTNEVLS